MGPTAVCWPGPPTRKAAADSGVNPDAVKDAASLAASDPTNDDWQRDLSISHNRIGDVLVAQGDLPGALDAYNQGMAVSKRLAEQDRGNAKWQRDPFVSLFKITSILLQIGNRSDACPVAQRLDQQAKLLAGRFPHDLQRKDYFRAAEQLLAEACVPDGP